MIVVRIPNNIPESTETLDLKLNADEAVVSYNENGEVKYVKISSIKQKQPLIYKGAPQN